MSEVTSYAALVSLMNIIEQIQNHPRPPISLDREQVESLSEKIAFLQYFLEGHSPYVGRKEEEGGLWSRIADAAYAAQDIIESHIIHQILPESSTPYGGNMSSVDLYQGLQRVMRDLDSMKKEVMEIGNIPDDLPHGNPTLAVPTRSYPSTGRNMMMGFDDVFEEIKDMLISHQSHRRIIPIVGMAGIGKTTLAGNVYNYPDIVDCFDIRAWVGLSREFSAKEILLAVLCQNYHGSMESLNEKSERELGNMLMKRLFGRKYLVVLDDMWSSSSVWDKIKFYFPDNNIGSRILITTRNTKVALRLTGTRGLQMKFLDEIRSWKLLRKIVFQEDDCPFELEEIGKKIAKKCEGLPLSIVVIGGILAKSDSAGIWEYVAENLSSILNEHCSKILHISYDELPIYLKPCFLYMGIFLEDDVIRASQLIRMWVAEGFVKPIGGKSLEQVAEYYLEDLIDRNLVLIRERKFLSRKVKSCSIHNLLRDMCIREADKFKFFHVPTQNSTEFMGDIGTQRRLVVRAREEFPRVCRALQFTSPTRSLICDFHEVLPWLNFRLLRVLKAVDRCVHDGEKRDSDGEEKDSSDTIFQPVNLRYLDIVNGWNRNSTASNPLSFHLMWNLQTLIVKDPNERAIAPPEIWKMPQLRHVEFNELYIPDPPSDHVDMQDVFVLVNLQTLLKVVNFKLGEEVVMRIPNVRKLQFSYDKEIEEGFDVASYYCLNNLRHLYHLESLACSFFDGPCRSDLLHNLTFPHSLKELTLYGTKLYWEDMSTMIGSLPLLEVLRLKHGSFIGCEWETVEGQFCSLRVLIIGYCDSLRQWLTDSCHFPCLESLVLRHLYKLKEIPRGIGDIPTLELIQLDCCSDSAVISAKRILEEQEDLGNDGLQVNVLLLEENHELQSLASRNSQVRLLSED